VTVRTWFRRRHFQGAGRAARGRQEVRAVSWMPGGEGWAVMSKRNSRAGKAARREARARKPAIPPCGPGTSDPELPAVLEVRLHRMVGEDAEGGYVSWAAEWAFQGADVAVEETSDDLPGQPSPPSPGSAKPIPTSTPACSSRLDDEWNGGWGRLEPDLKAAAEQEIDHILHGPH